METLSTEPEPRVKGIERLAREAALLLEKRAVEYLRIEARSILAELKRRHGFPGGPEFNMPTPLHEDEAMRLPFSQIESAPRAAPYVPSAPRGNLRSDTGQLQPMRYSEPCLQNPIRVTDPKGGPGKQSHCAVAET